MIKKGVLVKFIPVNNGIDLINPMLFQSYIDACGLKSLFAEGIQPNENDVGIVIDCLIYAGHQVYNVLLNNTPLWIIEDHLYPIDEEVNA